jgi:hypothetical protein
LPFRVAPEALLKVLEVGVGGAVLPSEAVINADTVVATVRVCEVQGIVSHVGVSIPTLRIVLIFEAAIIPRIRTHEAPHARRIVSSPKVIQAGLDVAFFAGRIRSSTTHT